MEKAEQCEDFIFFDPSKRYIYKPEYACDHQFIHFVVYNFFWPSKIRIYCKKCGWERKK